jgi:hypothetical protein
MSGYATPIRLCLLIIALTHLFTGCDKRYWYRQKVKQALVSAPPRYGKINVVVRNTSPAYLSRKFERSVRGYCLYSLRRKGFTDADEDTADFDLVLQMRIDSFLVSGITKPYMRYNYYYYNYVHVVRQITIRYELVKGARRSTCWDFQNEYYFFDDEPVDLKRTRSMINYSLRQMFRLCQFPS